MPFIDDCINTLRVDQVITRDRRDALRDPLFDLHREEFDCINLEAQGEALICEFDPEPCDQDLTVDGWY